MTQTGLVKKALHAAGMQDARPVPTPATTKPLGLDRDGAPFDEPWEYCSIVGLLMYLAANSRPDIAYATHAAARFTHAPKASHALAVKRILRYLKGTADKGLILRPTDEQRVDCYVDSDFAGLFGVEDDQDPTSVKSRTGYVIMYRGTPLLWISKMQTQVALSTMEAEYLALSQSMRDLIPIREVLKEIMKYVLGTPDVLVKYHSHSKAYEEVSGSEYEPESLQRQGGRLLLLYLFQIMMTTITTMMMMIGG